MPTTFTWPGAATNARGTPVETDVDLGTDIACLSDIDGMLSLTSGLTNLGYALVRRLTTPRGGLFYDPDYGYDLRELLNAGLSDASISAIGGVIEAECRKDERVQEATVAATYLSASKSLRVSIAVQTADGPFDLVLAVSAVTVEILSLA